jgi:hypothetical protein
MKLMIHKIVKDLHEPPRKTQIVSDDSSYEVPKTPDIYNIEPLDESPGFSMKINSYEGQKVEGPYNTIHQDDIRPVQ